MKFYVRRTSCVGMWRIDTEEYDKLNDESDIEKMKPCEEATEENRRWVITINTLEDLINFMKQHEEEEQYRGIIITRTKIGYQIEIYDDWIS